MRRHVCRRKATLTPPQPPICLDPGCPASNHKIGYAVVVGPSRWGRGLATEAGRALLAHGFQSHGLERIVAITHPGNLKSQAVMQRLGMRFERRTTGGELGLEVTDVAIVLYAMERQDA